MVLILLSTDLETVLTVLTGLACLTGRGGWRSLDQQGGVHQDGFPARRLQQQLGGGEGESREEEEEEEEEGWTGQHAGAVTTETP